MNYVLKISILITGFLIVSACENKSTSFSLPSTSQSFGTAVTYNNKVDILFVIDNSNSMMQYQQRLADRIPDMINSLNQLKMDYHVAVTTTTMTTNSDTYPMTRQILGTPKFLTAANISLLQARILNGQKGSDNERGLDALAFATGDYASTQAPGFLRSDAFFSVIFLGDEDDNSSEFGDASKNDFIDYMNIFRPKFKDGGKAWIANFIGNLPGTSCDNLGGTPSVGTKYIKVVDASGGVKASICANDFSSIVSNIKARIIDITTAFRLKDVPDKATIKIAVGGVLIGEDPFNGWTLETELTNGKTVYIIKFHGTSVPAADQEINIDYTPISAS